MGSRLVHSLATTDALLAAIDDRALIRQMLAFEVALARVQARAGVIPEAVVAAIERAADPDRFDAGSLAREARASGTVAIPFVAALTERVREIDAASATYVHWGATSQDLADTALVLCLKDVHAVIAADHRRLADRLVETSAEHASTIMLGRTLLQPAVPITFGLKAAAWLAGADASWRRLVGACADALVLQFGGAAGTLAALGTAGGEIAAALARELGVPNPPAPWHTRREAMAALVASHGVYAASLGKIARDVSLLMQAEVGEVAEPGGRSSTMPQKQNPAGCAIVLAAATHVPGLVASYLSAMIQEHERAVGGWHAEWPIVSAIVQATGSAAEAMARTVDSLQIFPDRMRRHVEATRGAVFAERATLRLAAALGRDAARRLVEEALAQSAATGETLGRMLARHPEAAGAMTPGDLERLDRPEDYLGSAERLRLDLVAAATRTAV